MSAVNGSAGQSDYAIANEILNKSAYFLRLSHPWCRIVAFDWGRIDGGMVTPELKKMFEDAGKAVIPLDVAVNTFLAVLAREDQVQGQIVVGAPATTEPIPLHAQPLMGPELRTYRVRRTLSLDVNPFVRDHIVAGHPVLPIVAAITWMAGTCEGLYPRHHVIRIDDIALLKGIVFDSDLAPEYILDLTEVSKGGSGEVDVDATLWSVTASGQTRYHYKCRIALATHLVDPPSTHPVDTLSREQWVDGGLFYRDGTLFHGPSFQGIRKVLAAADQSMVLECAVPATPDAHLGQFRSDALNPLTTDVSLQSLLVWTRSHRGAAALPARIGRVELFRSIKAGETFYAWMQVKASDENRVSADVVTADYGGRVHARFSDAEVTLSRQLNRLFQGAATG